MNRRRAVVAVVVAGAGAALAYWLVSTRRMVSDAPPGALPAAPMRGLAPTQAGQFFSFDDLAVSATAAARGVQNVITGDAAANLRMLTYNVLDPLVRATGWQVKVTSGYRSAAVNALISGSAADSQHMNGEAVDFNVSGVPSEAVVATVLRLGLPFDQLIWYANTNHTHVSFTTKRTNRRQVLYKDAAGKYVARMPAAAPALA